MIRLLAGFKNRLRQKRGQGMTEYIIIVALISVAAIAVVTRFSTNVRAMFVASSNAIAGDTNTDVLKTGGKTMNNATEKTTAQFGHNTDEAP